MTEENQKLAKCVKAKIKTIKHKKLKKNSRWNQCRW